MVEIWWEGVEDRQRLPTDGAIRRKDEGNHFLGAGDGGPYRDDTEAGRTVCVISDPAWVPDLEGFTAVVLGGDLACSLFELKPAVLSIVPALLLRSFARNSAQESEPPHHIRFP
jgi:hypothetical protein